MNEQAINTMYQLAQREGYKKSYEDFTTLLGENEQAMNTMYGLAQQEGYKNSIDDFYGLMGVEKKNLVGSQEEFEPASEEDFLAYTPTSGQADIDLGSSSIEDGVPSDEQQKAINELAALAQYQDTEERSLAEQTAKEIV